MGAASSATREKDNGMLR